MANPSTACRLPRERHLEDPSPSRRTSGAGILPDWVEPAVAARAQQPVHDQVFERFAWQCATVVVTQSPCFLKNPGLKIRAAALSPQNTAHNSFDHIDEGRIGLAAGNRPSECGTDGRTITKRM
jgi:hypothetical protein